METALKSLLKNILDSIENIEMIAIVDNEGLPIASVMKSDEEEIIGAISASFESFINRIKQEYKGSDFENITSYGEYKFYFTSKGNESESIFTMVGNKNAEDTAMKVYGEFAIGKIIGILNGHDHGDVEIPRILEILAKFPKVPSGEYTAKLIVCGDYSVGKTSLIRRLVDDSFKEDYIATIGVDISKKSIEINENLKINFLIWDISGQIKQMAPYRKRFYTGANGAFIIFDMTRKETFDNIKTWLADISGDLSQNIPKVIIGNKNDLADHFQINNEEIQKLSDELGIEFINTSAKTGENVLDAFKYTGLKIVEKS